MSVPKKKYITTPIYYVNAKPHLGHTYTTMLCDTLAKYYRFAGSDVFFLTGTDEHGDKIVKAASKEGKTPQEYTDFISSLFRTTWDTLHIEYDDFIRTTEDRHKKVVRQVLQIIYEKGDIYLADYEGLYCTGCERYLTEKELNEKGECPDHLTKPELIQEKNYFFKLQKYLPKVKKHIEENPDFISPDRYRNEALGAIEELIKQGEDLSISRPKARLTWGIELPFDSSFVTYVWFDALLNYISALGYPDNELYTRFWPAHHFIAKDILKPHAIFWPAMLMAAEIPLYEKLSVHGYWLGWGDIKMSKSLGNAADPLELTNKLGEDALRYFLAREMRFGSDAKFSEEIVITRLNTELSNEIGNLFQRTLSMILKYANHLPKPQSHDIEQKLNAILQEVQTEYHKTMQKERTDLAIEQVLKVTGFLNKAIEEYKPWEMAKTNDENLLPLLTTIFRGTLVCFAYLRPFLPNTWEKLTNLISFVQKEVFPKELSAIEWDTQNMEKPKPFFPRFTNENH
ncbi:MAG: methionine--tRNA ligase [Candidatus Hydrogenedentota bacterium]|nr:MAG: methionine--tRNA ligase [Candidatus Hydrogenedentota bacterium]